MPRTRRGYIRDFSDWVFFTVFIGGNSSTPLLLWYYIYIFSFSTTIPPQHAYYHRDRSASPARLGASRRVSPISLSFTLRLSLTSYTRRGYIRDFTFGPFLQCRCEGSPIQLIQVVFILLPLVKHSTSTT